jgi:hypothetical protein
LAALFLFLSGFDQIFGLAQRAVASRDLLKRGNQFDQQYNMFRLGFSRWRWGLRLLWHRVKCWVDKEKPRRTLPVTTGLLGDASLCRALWTAKDASPAQR